MNVLQIYQPALEHCVTSHPFIIISSKKTANKKYMFLKATTVPARNIL